MEKMKIAYNSADVLKEAISFTCAQQIIIVYFYLCSNFQEITLPNVKY